MTYSTECETANHATLFALTSKKILYADTKKYEIQRLKCILKNQNRPNGFPLELFNLAAETISFDEDEQVVLKLINGQTIRKEHAYAAS